MIERIEIFVTELPVRLKRIFSSGSYDTGAPRDLLGKPVLVKIYADGIVGIGQIRPISPGHFVPDTVHSVIGAIAEIYGPALIGRELSDIESIQEMFAARLAQNPAARAVLDIALHDALGKALGVPVHRLIGGRSQSVIPLEWSVSLAHDAGEMVAEAQRAVDEFGIRVLCLKAAGPEGWRRDVMNFEMVRKAVGEDVVIGVDPNTGWSVSETIAAMRALAPMGLGYVEQPVARHDLSGMAEIRLAGDGVPVMADEALFSLADASALAKSRACDVYCIKLYKHGGLSPARKLAAVAEAFAIRLNCGGLAVQSQLEAAASAHFCASIPASQSFGAAEFVFGLGVIGPDPLVPEPGLVIRDGAVEVPDGPGLGIAVDEDALERCKLKKITIDQRPN